MSTDFPLRLVILQENKEPLVFSGYVGALNHFFFSEDYVKNQEKAIDTLISHLEKVSDKVDPKKSLTPLEWGITIMDFRNNRLYEMGLLEEVGQMAFSFFQDELKEEKSKY